MQSQQRRLWIVLGVAILVIVLFFLLRPAVKGYGVYGDLKDVGVPEEYIGEMGALAAENAAILEDLGILSEREEEIEALLSACSQRTEELGNNFEMCAMDFARHRNVSVQLADSLAAEKAQAQQELRVCESERDETIHDAAQRICCVEKALTDPEIGSYEVVESRIVCRKGEEGEKITC